jgi:hypothetical protein
MRRRLGKAPRHLGAWTLSMSHTTAVTTATPDSARIVRKRRQYIIELLNHPHCAYSVTADEHTLAITDTADTIANPIFRTRKAGNVYIPSPSQHFPVARSAARPQRRALAWNSDSRGFCRRGAPVHSSWRLPYCGCPRAARGRPRDPCILSPHPAPARSCNVCTTGTPPRAPLSLAAALVTLPSACQHCALPLSFFLIGWWGGVQPPPRLGTRGTVPVGAE